MKKTICIIGPNKNLNGGISTVINQYTNSYLSCKYNVTDISSYGDNKIKEFLLGIKKYKKIIKTESLDLVHINTASKGSFMRKSIFICLTPKYIPIILHIHGGGFIDFYDKSPKILKKFIKRILKRVNGIIVLSNKFKEILIKRFGLERNKIYKLYNGIKIENACINFDCKKNQVLYMGKINENKGIYDLFESIPRLHKTSPETIFIIAGNGEINKANEIVKKNNMSSYVKVVGWIGKKRKRRYLNESSILIMPSHFEAFGISIIEAMQYGLAIVATNVGGIPEIIEDNINGKLVNKSDINQLTKSIDFYIKNDLIREKVGCLNIRKAKKFDLNNIICELDLIYDKFINKDFRSN